MLQFNCFICSKRERKTGLCGNRACKSIRALAELQTGLQEPTLYLWGASPAQGKTSQIAAVIGTSSSILMGRPAALPGNHGALSKALGSVAKAKLFLSFLSLCVCDVWAWTISSSEPCLSSNGSTVKLEPGDLQQLPHPLSLLGNSCQHRRDPAFIFRVMRSKASSVPG